MLAAHYCYCVYTQLILSFVITILQCCLQMFSWMLLLTLHALKSYVPVPMTAELPDARKEECNWSTGRWVYDNLSRPLYSGLKCSFIFPELSCDKYGRKDVMYQHWRWQPYGCDLPRYDYNRFSQFGSISSSVLFMSLSSQQLKRKIWRWSTSITATRCVKIRELWFSNVDVCVLCKEAGKHSLHL